MAGKFLHMFHCEFVYIIFMHARSSFVYNYDICLYNLMSLSNIVVLWEEQIL